MSSPVVSVCIPAYNGEKYLRETLDSVLAQTYKDFELLVVDDHSSDTTHDILFEYASKDNRIRIVRNEKNLGLVGNWNRCVELAYGEWIKFVFQDDVIAPDCIEHLLEICKTGSLFAVCRRDIIFDKDAESLRKYYKEYSENITIEKLFHGKMFISPEIFRSTCLKYLDDNFIGEPTAVILHKSIFQKWGTFNPYLIQLCDHEFWFRVGIHEGFAYVPKNLASFRVHNDGTSFVNREKRTFRMGLLDTIILLHEFAFNPVYEPLRCTAIRQTPPINFRDMLIYKVHEAIAISRSKRKAEVHAESNDQAEWQQISRHFPVLMELPVRGLPRLFHAIIRRSRVLRNHLNLRRPT